MEAIDDYANETIIRSLALTALTHRKQQNYSPLLAISSLILQQRLHYLNPSLAATPSAWDTALQWQPDGSAEALRTLWNDKDDAKDELLQAEVRYRRLDLETLYAMIEFAHGDGGVRYVVVMMLEEGGEVQEWRYHNTREIGKEEWEGEVAKEWSNTLEEAEKRFVLGVAAKRSLDGKKSEKPKTEKLKNVSKKNLDRLLGNHFNDILCFPTHFNVFVISVSPLKLPPTITGAPGLTMKTLQKTLPKPNTSLSNRPQKMTPTPTRTGTTIGISSPPHPGPSPLAQTTLHLPEGAVPALCNRTQSSTVAGMTRPRPSLSLRLRPRPLPRPPRFLIP